MEVFERENNWSSYQNRQLDVLQSLEKSFRSDLEISKAINNNLTKIEYAMDSIAKELVSNVEDYSKGMNNAVANMEINLKNATDSLSKTSKQIAGTGDEIEKSGLKLVMTIQTIGGSFQTLIKNVWDYLGGVRGITSQIDRFSYISNDVIQTSGMSGSVVREFRGDLMGIIADLNSVTGALYSPLESYSQLMQATRGVTSDLEAVGEMARPLLLAQETLDTNISSIADIFNRFYVRYSFSSTNMEDALNEIRGNTAGNSANAEATVENIKALEKWISVVAGDDNLKREQMLEEISHYTSWLESMDMDSTPYTGYLESIAYGDWSNNKELINILSRRGIGALEAQSMVSAGQWGKLTEEIVYGMRDMISTVQDSTALGRALDNLGVDRNTAMDNWATLDSKNFVSFEEFLENVSKETPSLVELAEDKYVTAADKANHWLEQIYEKLASIQEYLPFGFSDLALAYALTRDALPRLNSLSISGRFSRVGPNLPGSTALTGLSLAGIGAGIGLGAYGISQGVSDIQQGEIGAGAANMTGGVLGIAGAGSLVAGMAGVGAANVWNPIGWGLIAASAVTLLGTAIYKDMTELSGNAKEVQNAFSDIERSLDKERREIISSLSGLQRQFDQAETIEEQRSLLLSAGLATREELASLEEEAMQGLIDAYLEGAKQISDITSKYLETRKSEIAGEQSTQQEEFMKALSGKVWTKDPLTGQFTLNDTDADRDMYTQIIHELKKGVTDEKLLELIDKYMKDDIISASEFERLTTDQWYGDNNLVKKSVGTSYMQNIVSAYGSDLGISDMVFSTWDQATEEMAADLLDSFVESWERWTVDPTNAILKNQLISQIESMTSPENKTYYDLIYDELGIYRKAATTGDYAKYKLPAFADGTNYVSQDQVAIVHEGEAIIPKKYNPAANIKEMRDIAAQSERSREESNRLNQETTSYLAAFIDELQEIKEFLAIWKDDNERREKLAEAKSRHEASRTFVSKYMSF